MLCILTIERVLRKRLSSQNHLFKHFNTFFVTNKKRRRAKNNIEKIQTKGAYQRLDATFKCWLTLKCWDSWIKLFININGVFSSFFFFLMEKEVTMSKKLCWPAMLARWLKYTINIILCQNFQEYSYSAYWERCLTRNGNARRIF